LRIGFVGEVSRREGIGRIDLVEKDVILHELLTDLSNSPFGDDYLFKGGTCLIKGYLGYYRFSEDVDFTYRDQLRFEDLSQKGLIKHKLSRSIGN
jgi:predicted nucleotidyltransferase component of viral defense system